MTVDRPDADQMHRCATYRAVRRLAVSSTSFAKVFTSAFSEIFRVAEIAISFEGRLQNGPRGLSSNRVGSLISYGEMRYENLSLGLGRELIDRNASKFNLPRAAILRAPMAKAASVRK